MIFSEIYEYLSSRLKVQTEINGFLLSIDASMYQKPKIENLIFRQKSFPFLLLAAYFGPYLGSWV